jgi:hypothetical protein
MASPDFGMPTSSVSAGRRPKTTAYMMLLVISLVALLVGCLFLFLEIKRYGGFGAIRGRVAAAQSAVENIAALPDRIEKSQA